MQELVAARLRADFGVEKCAHARQGGKRQVLLVDWETLQALDLLPGQIRENITIEGLDVNGLTIGERLQVGESLLEVSAVCTPCDELEKVRPGLQRELRGCRGMLCRVLEGGRVHPSDPIKLVEHTNLVRGNG